jgi:hypothetical protein
MILTQHIKTYWERNAELFSDENVGTWSNDQAVEGQARAVCQWRPSHWRRVPLKQFYSALL